VRVGVDEVRRIARLARLPLSETEAAKLTAELSDILDHVDALGESDVDHVDAIGGISEHVARPAPDRPGADALAHGLDAVAAGWTAEFFTVPRLASHDDAADA
jgi:aspartyl-tRNA(Asn)/glutamyl-tRNA(Gln) amidotransferase subunit C